MYTDFYGLREKPFALSPDPRFLYLAASHREALAHLLYGIEQGEGFISVTGEVGTGKTTLCRTLLERLEGELEVAFLFNPSRTALELLQTICAEFGLPAEGLARRSLMAQLNGFLLEKKSEGRRVLLIIDEAQTLSENTLEQVRLLSNLETSREKLIQILLLGQPELDRKLDEQGLRQLRQRISVRWQLEPLAPTETKSYVRHRIAVAAGEPKELFSDGALREIHRRTGGIPRLVNQLCDRALLGGYAARAAEISPKLIRAAAKEIPDTQRARALPQFERPSRPWHFFAGMLAIVGVGVVAGLQFGQALVSTPPSANASEIPALNASLPGVQIPPSVDAPPPGFEQHTPRGTPGYLSAKPAPSSPATLSPGVLAERLATRDSERILAETEEALLRGFGKTLTGVASPARSAADLEKSLNDRGLVTTAFKGGSIDLLGRLEHPVALALHADGAERLGSDSDGDRWVALMGIEGDRLRLAGLYAGREVTVSRDELASLWTESGLIVWHRFERIPDSLSAQDLGSSVVWLQTALADLGFFSHEASGHFDTATTEALSRFQRDRGLPADGKLGPLTQIALFGQLSRYPVPRLSAPPRPDFGFEAPQRSPSNRAMRGDAGGGERG